MTTSLGVSDQQNDQPSTFGERLAFAIWLAGKVLGVENAKDFAGVLGKGQPQLSRWLREDPRPAWPTIKQIAEAVDISALWLDDPTARGAIEPEDFGQWLENRRARAARAARARSVEYPTGAETLARAVAEGTKAPRGAQVEPKDVPAADPRKKPAAEPGKGKRAG